MLDVLRFWLDRGVDGFRVDALRQLIKDDQLRDNPPNPTTSSARGPTMPCCRSTPPTDPSAGYDRADVGVSSTNMTGAC